MNQPDFRKFTCSHMTSGTEAQMADYTLMGAVRSLSLHPKHPSDTACKHSLKNCGSLLQPLNQYSDGDWKRVLAEMNRGEQRP